jgi:hypothetical protein
MAKQTGKRRNTGESSAKRLKQFELRLAHKDSIRDGSLSEALPESLAPDLFSDIEEIYWKCLQSVKDPRAASLRIYPLDLILHRIISGLIDGTQYIGILFPKKQRETRTDIKRQLGLLPTRPAVYALLRRIDWDLANVELSPLWKRLGYTPELVVTRKLRDPKVILKEFEKKQKDEKIADVEKVQSKKKEKICY